MLVTYKVGVDLMGLIGRVFSERNTALTLDQVYLFLVFIYPPRILLCISGPFSRTYYVPSPRLDLNTKTAVINHPANRSHRFTFLLPASHPRFLSPLSLALVSYIFHSFSHAW